jgi:hypothetical protein
VDQHLLGGLGLGLLAGPFDELSVDEGRFGADVASFTSEYADRDDKPAFYDALLTSNVAGIAGAWPHIPPTKRWLAMAMAGGAAAVGA